MPDQDEIAWGVGNRAGALKTLNEYVTDGGTGEVLYYPGSGADVMHPLFAAYSATKYLVFADILESLPANIDEAIKTKSTRLERDDAREHAGKLKIDSEPAAGWTFKFKDVDRYVLLFRAGHDSFLGANKKFEYDVLFDKDFWETSAEIDLGVILGRLRLNGFYLTNSSLGFYRPFLEALNLKYLEPVQLNGAQYVWHKIGQTPQFASAVQDTVKAARRESAGFLFDELGFNDNSDAWTDDEWTDVLAAAVIKARNAIAKAMQMGDGVWDAAEGIVREELHGAMVYKDQLCTAGKVRAKTASPNLDPIVQRATTLLS